MDVSGIINDQVESPNAQFNNLFVINSLKEEIGRMDMSIRDPDKDPPPEIANKKKPLGNKTFVFNDFTSSKPSFPSQSDATNDTDQQTVYFSIE